MTIKCDFHLLCFFIVWYSLTHELFNCIHGSISLGPYDQDLLAVALLISTRANNWWQLYKHFHLFQQWEFSLKSKRRCLGWLKVTLQPLHQFCFLPAALIVVASLTHYLFVYSLRILSMYAMYFDQINLPFPLYSSWTSFPQTLSQFHIFLNAINNPFSTASMSMGTGPVTLQWTTFQGVSVLKKTGFHIQRIYQLLMAPQLRVESYKLPLPLLECWLAWSFTGLAQTITTAVS